MNSKITINEDSPSQAMVNDANKAFSAKDARGRTIAVKKLKPWDRLKMLEVIGAGQSDNAMYVGYASLVFYVVKIDDEAIARPTSKLQVEALMQRLDDDGLDTVGSLVEEHFGEKKLNPAAIKN
jgi:hypothetical protein